MSEALTKLAFQFAESNREEQRWLRDERNSLRHLLAAVVLQSGGELVLDDRSRLAATPDDVLEYCVDTWNRCLLIRCPSRAPAVTKVEKADQLPDWML